MVDLSHARPRSPGGRADAPGVPGRGTARGPRWRASDATDDASLVEAIGGRVVLVEGPPDNLKVTSPLDLVVAAALASVVQR